MPNVTGSDDSCGCGVLNCDGSCRDNNRCSTCGSILCRGESREGDDSKHMEPSSSLQRVRLERELKLLNARVKVIQGLLEANK